MHTSHVTIMFMVLVYCTI